MQTTERNVNLCQFLTEDKATREEEDPLQEDMAPWDPLNSEIHSWSKRQH